LNRKPSAFQFEPEPESGSEPEPNSESDHILDEDREDIGFSQDIDDPEYRNLVGLNDHDPFTSDVLEEEHERFKRPRAGSTDSVKVDLGPLRKAKRMDMAEGWPKVKDFEADVQDAISAAILHYRAELSTKNAYPDVATEMSWAKTAWKSAYQEKELDIGHSAEILTLVSKTHATHFAF
jgi:hypothetical protein